jgi:ABC-type sugar transport system substrate-binding protein
VRAAKEAEEAEFMAEAQADVTLVTTIIATADADNSRQQTTINNRIGAKPCLAVAMTEVASWR